MCTSIGPSQGRGVLGPPGFWPGPNKKKSPPQALGLGRQRRGAPPRPDGRRSACVSSPPPLASSSSRSAAAAGASRPGARPPLTAATAHRSRL
uniref:Uncharacterized protein n=1 Tax=Oryza nivara TaxID=4536 RepID=A0A0E0J2T8_ORYNI